VNEERFKMITVRSALPISIAVHLDRLVETDHGAMEARRIGAEVVLRPGENQVDDAFWRAWSTAHAGSALAAHFTEEGHGDPLSRESLSPSGG
jgi:hypothetical protein